MKQIHRSLTVYYSTASRSCFSLAQSRGVWGEPEGMSLSLSLCLCVCVCVCVSSWQVFYTHCARPCSMVACTISLINLLFTEGDLLTQTGLLWVLSSVHMIDMIFSGCNFSGWLLISASISIIIAQLLQGTGITQTSNPIRRWHEGHLQIFLH